MNSRGKPLCPPSRDQRGFALVITVTLLAFLVLILVALATLTRVETQVAGNHQQLAQARQNALLALNIALGQLQKHAGPDQRVTGTADLAADANGNPISSGNAANGTATNGLVSPQNGTRYWTGVWGNSDPSAPVASNGNIFEKTPAPVLLNWLVSGNEDVTLDATRFDLATGRITAGAALPTGSNFRPNDQTDLTGANVAGTYLGKVRGLNAAILLGRNTVGSTPADAAHYVLAPLVDIKSEQVSGASSEQKIGRYAYWVGDEGVKARLNLVDKYSAYGDAAAANAVSLGTPSGTLNTTDGALARARLLTAPRSGLEAIADFSGSGYADRTQSPTPSANTADRMLSLSQAPFLDPAKITVQKLGQRFHDFTTHSVGLEADTLNGGLRRDLTYYFEQTTLPNWTGTNGESAGAGRPIIPAAYSPKGNYDDASTTPETHAPQWDLLHSFYNSAVAGDAAAGPGTVNVCPASPTRMGISPIIILFRLQVGVRRTLLGAPTEPADEGQTQSLFNGLAAPVIVLANPYTTRLAAPNGLSLEVLFSSEYDPDPAAKSPYAFPWVDLLLDANGTPAANNAGNYSVRLFATREAGGMAPSVDSNTGMDTGPALLSNIKFVIAANTVWEPGEAMLFTLQQDVQISTYGAPREVPLTPGRLSPALFKAVISPAKTVTKPNTRGITALGYRVDQYRYRGKSRMIPLQLELRDRGSSELSENLLQAVSGANMALGKSTDNRYEVAAGTALEATPIRVLEAVLVPPADEIYYDSDSLNGRDGQRNGELRLYQDFNPRAAWFRLTNLSSTVAPYSTMAFPGGLLTPASYPDGFLMGPCVDPFSPSSRQPWGRAVLDGGGAATQTAVLYDIPRRGLQTEMPVMSLGQLQHANLTADDLRINIGHQPAYAVGNSYASPFLKRETAVDAHQDRYYTQYAKDYGTDANGVSANVSANIANVTRSDGAYYAVYSKAGIRQWTPSTMSDNSTYNRFFDLSYLLNASLWDGYFFSTLPQASAQASATAPSLPPVNPRLRLIDTSQEPATVGNVLGGEKAAAHTVVDGAFNINSTSVAAWTALLGGMRSLPKPPLSNDAEASGDAIFPRTVRQSGIGTPAGDASGALPARIPTGEGEDSYSGFRRLTDAQIRTLAEAIVQEVRRRGPFVSLSHFINRALTAAAADSTGKSYAGALQTAIDASGTNTFSAVTAGDDESHVPPALSSNSATDPARDVRPVHNDAIGRGTWSLYADGANFTAGASTRPQRSTAIPGWLTQADVLQAIGPLLSARSDTFTIRTYGDVVNPVTGNTAARAWCEAVVQRLPEFLDPQDAATTRPASAHSINQIFGRRFAVVSFRWLGPDDI